MDKVPVAGGDFRNKSVVFQDEGYAWHDVPAGR